MAFLEKMLFISKKQLVPITTNLASGFLSVSFFKAGCTLVNLSRMAFPSVACSCEGDCGIYYACRVLD